MSKEKRELTEYLKVTVQLPLFNEQYVAERIIKGAIAIDYPRKVFGTPNLKILRKEYMYLP